MIFVGLDFLLVTNFQAVDYVREHSKFRRMQVQSLHGLWERYWMLSLLLPASLPWMRAGHSTIRKEGESENREYRNGSVPS